jgi:hypothetical protein
MAAQDLELAGVSATPRADETTQRQEPLARLALADLRGAIESPDDTVLLTYRAVESVRQWFLDGNEDDPRAREKSWIAMRSTLGVDKERTQGLAELAKSRRHGGATPSTGEERKEALLIARDVVERFVIHLNPSQADPSEPLGSRISDS